MQPVHVQVVQTMVLVPRDQLQTTILRKEVPQQQEQTTASFVTITAQAVPAEKRTATLTLLLAEHVNMRQARARAARTTAQELIQEHAGNATGQAVSRHRLMMLTAARLTATD